MLFFSFFSNSNAKLFLSVVSQVEERYLLFLSFFLSFLESGMFYFSLPVKATGSTISLFVRRLTELIINSREII